MSEPVSEPMGEPAASGPAASGPGMLDLDNYVPYWLASLSRLLVGRMQARLGEGTNLSIAEWRLMATVAGRPHANAVDVCRLTQMDDVAVHRAVGRLAAKGLLRREVSAHDKRRKRLELTEEGWSVYRRTVPAAFSVEAEFLDMLDGDDRAVLVRLLRRLHQAAQERVR